MSADPALRYVYWRFVVLGMATLMAWNVYITASGFFRHVFRNTPLRDSFESVFSIFSNTINLIALSYALYTQPSANNDRRIQAGLLSTVCVFLALLLLPLLNIEGWLALVIALLALCVAAVAAAFVQCSIFGIAAPLHACCAEAYMGGQAIAGTVASALQLFTVYGAEDDGRVRVRAGVYFGIAAVFLALSMAAWSQLSRHEMIAQNAYRALDGPDAGMGRMQHGSPRLTRDPEGPVEYAVETVELEQVVEQNGLPKWLGALGLNNMNVLCLAFGEIAPFAYICGSAMCLTLALFPPLTEAIVSSPKSSPQIANLTAWHFLLFNVGDYLGRLSTQWIRCESVRMLNWIGAARLLFVPAFLMFPTVATAPGDALVVHSDLLFLLLVAILGWSNGWVATMTLVRAPRDATNKALAGSVLSFALCVGLMVGALLSYPILLIAGIL